jgi:hypothetical protein
MSDRSQLGRGRRLVPSPIFVLSSIRSGSTLLRCVLNAHSQLHAPHELHLADLRIDPAAITTRALDLLGMNAGRLVFDLWDSVLHLLLAASGKQYIVDKTPGNLLLWRDIAAYWTQARYLFLLRHPANILASAVRSRPDGHTIEPTPLVTTYLHELRDAMAALPGLAVRYEDLTHDPAATTARICRFLHIDWEPQMCDYGRTGPGPLRFGIGDFGDKIRSGRIQPGAAPPPTDPLPGQLRDLCRHLGYGAPG